MAAPKGRPKPKGAGRVAGVPNKATANAREAIAAFVDGNADRLVGWLDKIADDSPKDAFNAFMSVVEYHIPKLQRSEVDLNQTNELDGASKDVINTLISELRQAIAVKDATDA